MRYQKNNVVYLCLDGEQGKAIVAGSRVYEVRFTLKDGVIGPIFCDCPYCDTCKHEAAVLFQLRESLMIIEKKYHLVYAGSGYFAIIDKAALLNFALNGDEETVLELR